MIKKIIQTIFVVLISLIIPASCFREFSIEPPECENCIKPVVLCFITPNKPIKVFATSSIPFLGSYSSSSREFKGRIFISDTTGLTIELYRLDGNPFLFTNSNDSFPIERGRLYTLKVIDSDGNESFATTRVPILSDKFTSVVIAGSYVEYNETQYLLKLNLLKRSNTNNIIGYAATLSQSEVMPKMALEYRPKYIQIDINTFEYSFVEFWRYRSYFTLFTIDESLDAYLNSYTIFDDIGVDVMLQDLTNTFNGIVPEYTNFSNSLGVFGAYVTDSISIVNPYPSPY